MSRCISHQGEYGEHEPGDWCPRCGAFNEEAIIAERDALRAEVERWRADFREWETTGAPNCAREKREFERRAFLAERERDALRAQLARRIDKLPTLVMELRDGIGQPAENMTWEEELFSRAADSIETLRNQLATARKEAFREAADAATGLIQGPPMDEYDRALAEVVHLIEQKQEED